MSQLLSEFAMQINGHFHNKWLLAGIWFAYLLTGNFGVMPWQGIPVVGEVFGILCFAISSLIIHNKLKGMLPLTSVLSVLITFLIIGIISRLLLFISAAYVELSPLIMLGLLISYSILRPTINKDTHDSVKQISERCGIAMYVLLGYGAFFALTITSFLFARSDVTTDVWSVMPTYSVFTYAIAGGLLVYTLAKLNFGYRVAYLLVFSFSILSLSVLPLIFSPVFGGDTIWFNIAHSKTIDLSLPSSSYLYSPESLFDAKTIRSSFLEVIPRTSVIIFSNILGINSITVAAWLNPFLASLAFPFSAFVIGRLLGLENRITYIAAISFLFAPTYFVYGLSVGWAMGAGIALFAAGFALILLWIERRSKSYIILIALFIAGTALTHPISGLFIFATFLAALAYVYFWRAKQKSKIFYLLTISALTILYPLLISVYFGSDNQLAPEISNSDFGNSVLRALGIEESLPIGKIIIRAVYPLVALAGVLILHFSTEKKSFLIFAAYASLMIMISFMIHDVLVHDPSITPGRELYHLYVTLFPLVIFGLASASRRLGKLKQGIVNQLSFAFAFALVLSLSFTYAYPVSSNKNGHLISLEIDAAKKLQELGLGKFGVITDFNNVWAGQSVYGIHNPVAFYPAPLSYDKISSYNNGIFSNSKEAVSSFLNEYSNIGKIYGVEEELDSVVVVLSSYRVSDKNRYSVATEYLSSVGLDKLQLTDEFGNEVRVFQVFSKTRTILPVSIDNLLEQELQISNNSSRLQFRNPNDMQLMINKITISGVHEDGHRYNLLVFHKDTILKDTGEHLLPIVLKPYGTFSMSVRIYPLYSGMHDVLLNTEVSFGNETHAVRTVNPSKLLVLDTDSSSYTDSTLQ